MLRFKVFILAAGSALVLAACSSSLLHTPSVSQMPPAINANGVMVAADSLMTLYTYAGDGLEQSACVDACAEIWQPLLANGRIRAGATSAYLAAAMGAGSGR